MIKNLITCFLLFQGVVLLSGIHASFMPHDFEYYVEFKESIIKDAIYQVHLGHDILEKCNTDCEDIRIFDSNNKEIPYVMLEYSYISEKERVYPLKVTEYGHDENSAVITLKTSESDKERNIQINAIYLDITDRDFRKEVIVKGSNDGKRWTLIKKDTIYDFSSHIDLRKKEIKFKDVNYYYYHLVLTDTKTQKDKHQSIKLKYNNLDFSVDHIKNKKLHIKSIKGKFNIEKSKNTIYDGKIFTDIDSLVDKNQNSVIIIGAKLPFERIYFDITNPYYYRKVEVYCSDTGKVGSYELLTKGSIYTFALSDVTDVKNYLYSSSRKHNFYKFVIENKNNPPLDIESVTFKWIQKNLYFVAFDNDTKYILCFGNTQTNKPEYDLSKFIHRDNWYKQSYTKLEKYYIFHNESFTLPLSKDKKSRIEKIILIVIVLFLILGISYSLYTLYRKAIK